jgi:hypothetical protein
MYATPPGPCQQAGNGLLRKWLRLLRFELLRVPVAPRRTFGAANEVGPMSCERIATPQLRQDQGVDTVDH